MQWLHRVDALTFDLFGTVMDIRGSTLPAIQEFLTRKDSVLTPEDFWDRFRVRQRVEQYQDNILMLGHTGYREAVRRAFVYTSHLLGLEASTEEVNAFLQVWTRLRPFPDVIPALERLSSAFRLVVLSNGERSYLEHLAKNRLDWEFDEIVSVETVGAFKPHPAVYRRAAGILNLEAEQCLMVSANSFDVMGARACSFKAAFVNRSKLPYEISPYVPDVMVRDFSELTDVLLG